MRVFVGDVAEIKIVLKSGRTNQIVTPSDLNVIVTKPDDTTLIIPLAQMELISPGYYIAKIEATLPVGRWHYDIDSPGPLGQGVDAGYFDVSLPRVG